MAGSDKTSRFAELDIYRGVAVAMMILYHFLYDLSDYRVVNVKLTNPFWRSYREFLVFLFLSISGACLYLSHHNQIRWPAFWKRTGINLIGAGLITLSTYIYNKNMVIYFGVLHFIVVAGFLSLPFLKKPKFALVLSLFLLIMGYVGQLNEAHNYVPYLSWIGLGSFKLKTYDYFPLIPYFGATLMGIFLIDQALKNTSSKNELFLKLNPLSPWNRLFAFLGRHALLIYLIHQPLLVSPFYFFVGR